MQRRRRDLTRPDEEQLAAVDLVDLGPVGGKETGVLHRVLAYQHGRNDRCEALGDDASRHPLHERELEQRAFAHQVREARPAHLDRLLGLDEADADAELGVIEWRRVAWLADDAQHLVVVFAAHRHGCISWVRHLEQQLPQTRLGIGERWLLRGELVLECARRRDLGVALVGGRPSDLLRRRVLARPELFDLGEQHPPGIVGLEHTVEKPVGDPLAFDAGPVFELVAQPPEVDHVSGSGGATRPRSSSTHCAA